MAHFLFHWDDDDKDVMMVMLLMLIIKMRMMVIHMVMVIAIVKVIKITMINMMVMMLLLLLLLVIDDLCEPELMLASVTSHGPVKMDWIKKNISCPQWDPSTFLLIKVVKPTNLYVCPTIWHCWGYCLYTHGVFTTTRATRQVELQGLLLLHRSDAVVIISANDSAACNVSCATIGENSCDSLM